MVDSREVEDGQAIRRRRSCPECSRRFSTVEEAVLAVVKRSGVTEPFSRAKVVVGVRRACQGRPVDEDALAVLAQQVEDAVRASGSAEIPSQEIGLAILGPLRELDEVAYLRFASVYRAFTSAEDFMAEIVALRADHPERGQVAQAQPETGSSAGPDADNGDSADGADSSDGADTSDRTDSIDSADPDGSDDAEPADKSPATVG